MTCLESTLVLLALLGAVFGALAWLRVRALEAVVTEMRMHVGTWAVPPNAPAAAPPTPPGPHVAPGPYPPPPPPPPPRPVAVPTGPPPIVTVSPVASAAVLALPP